MKLVTSILGVACLSALLTAQTEITPKTFSGDVQYVGSYNVATGVLVPPEDLGGGDEGEIVYDNTADNGFFFTPGPGLVNMDWGEITFPDHPFIVEAEIGYATDLPTVDLVFRLHQDALGFCDLGTVAGEFLVENLPGSDDGTPQGFVVTLDLADAGAVAFLPEGPIGYSYEMMEDNSGPLLVGPPVETSVVDAFDEYTSDLTVCNGTFFFGGDPFASFHCLLEGEEEEPEPECFLMLGTDDANAAWPSGDVLLVAPLMMWPVTIQTMPDFNVPNDPIVNGLELYWQTYMWNPDVFPDDPRQLSNGVKTVLGDPALPETYGAPTTMDLYGMDGTPLGGTIDLEFTIEDL